MKKKEVYTSGDVARILKVTTNTVTKWFDQGVIKGYTLPGSRARRITAGDFHSFVKKHGIPIERIQKEVAFTTAECARFCFVTTNTVTKWADKGLLPCFNLGGSNRRLVFQKELMSFMRENSIPLNRVKEYLAAPKRKKTRARITKASKKAGRKKAGRKAKKRGRKPKAKARRRRKR